MAKALGAYFGDSLKIFLIPVSTIAAAASRNLTLVNAGGVLVVMAIVAELVRIGIDFVPGGSTTAISAQAAVRDTSLYIVFFLVSLLIMYALSVVFGGKSSLRQLSSAKLDLAAALVGGLLIGLFVKLGIAILFMGDADGSAGMLINIGEQIGLLALGVITGVYGIIVLHFGGGLSWILSIIAGIVHVALMVSMAGVYSLFVLQNDLRGLQSVLQV